MLGNGAATKRAIPGLSVPAHPVARDDDEDDIPSPGAAGAEQLSARDPDRYELARIQKTEEEARKLRRQNAEAEGTVVLASEVQLQTARLIGQEIAEFENVLREAARRVADEMGVDFKAVRQILVAAWRAHRARRAEHLDDAAGVAEMTPLELAGDI